MLPMLLLVRHQEKMGVGTRYIGSLQRSFAPERDAYWMTLVVNTFQ
jgi:hypothetical protein